MFLKREWGVWAAVAIVSAAIIVGGAFLYYKPRTVTIAVTGPAGTDDAQLIAGIARGLVSESAPFRFKTTIVNAPGDAGKMLERGEVDLAVVRHDQPVPKNGQAIAILHRNPIVIVTLGSTGVTSLTDLVGKSIAAIGRNDLNKNLIGEILPYYNIKKDAISVLQIPPTDVAEALTSGKIAAVVVAGPITGRGTTEVMSQLSREHADELVFIPFETAEAIAKRAPIFEAVEIDAGSFGGNPPRPAKSYSTLQFSTYILASSSMSSTLAADIARNIFYLRPSLAIDLPSANRIEAPDTAKDAILPVHPGAAAYIDGEEKDMFDQLSDWFYLALFGGGVIASAFASLRRFAAPAGGVSDQALFKKLRDIIDKVKTAESEEQLAEYELELNEVFVAVLSKAEQNSLEDAQLGALSISIDHMRRIIESRRALWQRNGLKTPELLQNSS